MFSIKRFRSGNQYCFQIYYDIKIIATADFETEVERDIVADKLEELFLKRGIERLRNKLSPFMNLVKMLIDTNELVLPFTDSKLNDLFEAELKRCEDNYDAVLDLLQEI